jgi:hypothetical protein
MSAIEQSRTLSDLQERLADLAIARYIDWREACAAVAGLYGDWCAAGRGARRDAFLAYRSALESEEPLARLYAYAIARLERALWSEPPVPSTVPCTA